MNEASEAVGPYDSVHLVGQRHRVEVTDGQTLDAIGHTTTFFDIFDPYEKHHSTVRDACELAEGAPCFSGRLCVPDDLDVIEL